MSTTWSATGEERKVRDELHGIPPGQWKSGCTEPCIGHPERGLLSGSGRGHHPESERSGLSRERLRVRPGGGGPGPDQTDSGGIRHESQRVCGAGRGERVRKPSRQGDRRGHRSQRQAGGVHRDPGCGGNEENDREGEKDRKGNAGGCGGAQQREPIPSERIDSGHRVRRVRIILPGWPPTRRWVPPATLWWRRAGP